MEIDAELLIIGIAIAGGRDKIKTEDTTFEETVNNIENTGESLSVKI